MPTSHRRRGAPLLTLVAGLAVVSLGGCRRGAPPVAAGEPLPAAEGLVVQDANVSLFEPLQTGGRIELQTEATDDERVRRIRRFVRDLMLALRSGDFSAPPVTHLSTVPGAEAMAARRGVIYYSYRELPGGAELLITTRDLDAVRAVHNFLLFERSEPRGRIIGDPPEERILVYGLRFTVSGFRFPVSSDRCAASREP